MTCLFQVSLLCAPGLLVAHLSRTRLSRHFGALRLRRQLGPGGAPPRLAIPATLPFCHPPHDLHVSGLPSGRRGWHIRPRAWFCFPPPPPSALLSESLTTACPLARCQSLSLGLSPVASGARSLLLMPQRTMQYCPVPCRGGHAGARTAACVAGLPSPPLACMVSLAKGVSARAE